MGEYSFIPLDSGAAARAGFRQRREAIRKRRSNARLLQTGLAAGWIAGLGVAAAIIAVEFAGMR